MNDRTKNKQRFVNIILAYPVVLVLISIILNLFIFGVAPVAAALPAPAIICALVVSAVALALNHTWLMTHTELTRLKYDLHATPEEWAASGRSKTDTSDEALQELERSHNAHRNATENLAPFAFLAIVFCFTSPTTLTAQIWIIGFALSRLGYTFSYLRGMDNARAVFMSLSLAAMYGLASYLVIALFI